MSTSHTTYRHGAIRQHMKTCILLCAFICVISNSSAQFSVKAGVNLANQNNELSSLSSSWDNKIGAQLGLNYKFMLSKSFSIRPGIQYSPKGVKRQLSTMDLSNDFKYLEVPMNLIYRFKRLSIYTGPYMAYLMSATFSGKNIKEEVEPLEFGVDFGTTFSFQNLEFGLNLGLGLTNLNKDKSAFFRNRVVSIYALYSQ